MVIGLFRCRYVRSYAPWLSSSTIGVVVFIQVCPVGRRVHSGSLVTFGCTLVVVGFIWRPWVHSSASWGSSGSFGAVGYIRLRPWGSSGSFGDVAFIWVRRVCRQVHSGTFGSLGCALGVAGCRWEHSSVPWVSSGFIRGRLVHSGAPLVSSGPFVAVGVIPVCPGVVVFFQVSWLNSVAHWWSCGSFGAFEFILVPGVCRVPSGSLGSFVCAHGVFGFVRRCSGAPWWSMDSFGIIRLIWVLLVGRWVHLGSLCSFGCAMGVVGLIRVRSGAPWVSMGSFWSLDTSCALWVPFGTFVFVRVRSVNSGSPLVVCILLGSFGIALVGVGFIWCRSVAPRGSSGTFGVDGLIRVRPGGRRVRSASKGSFGYTLRLVRFTQVCPGGRGVHAGSLSSFGCALVIDGFIRGRWVHSGAPCVSSGSFGDEPNIRVRPCGHWVVCGLLGCALGVV